MSREIFTGLQEPLRIMTKPLEVPEGCQGVDDRQRKVPGFSQEALASSVVLLGGAGGIGGEIGEGLVRKGVGRLEICDPDVVEPSNLNRQRFYAKDLFRNKAVQLAENLAAEAFMGTEITGYPLMYEEYAEENHEPTIGVCGVDRKETRIAMARDFYEKGLPLVFTAVSEDADTGYVFIQEPGKACFGCLFPEEVLRPGRNPCPGSPAVKDILKLMGALVLYAIDTVLMDRKRNWNYRQVFLAGFAPEKVIQVEKRPDCPICGRVKKPVNENFSQK